MGRPYRPWVFGEARGPGPLAWAAMGRAFGPWVVGGAARTWALDVGSYEAGLWLWVGAGVESGEPFLF